MKQALNILIAYLTCTDPVIQNKWLNLLHSFWHKDSGWLLKSITTISGGYRFTVLDGDGNETPYDINIPTLPNSQPMSYIDGLELSLNSKVDKVVGKGLSTNDFTTALKSKLDGLQNYVHPDFHQISEIEGLQDLIDTLAVYDNLAEVAKTNDYNDLDNTPISYIETALDFVNLSLEVGLTVSTKGYAVVGDGGYAFYKIVENYELVDEIGLGFSLPNGNIAALISDRKSAANFGIFPDGVTDWEFSAPERLNALLKASQHFTIHFEEGLYFTKLGLTNLFENVKLNFNNSEFGNVIHLVSSESIIRHAQISSIVSEGSTLLITTSSAHGAVLDRKITFKNTDTDLDGLEILAEVVNTTQLRIAKDSYSGVLNTVDGFLMDAPLRNVTMTGSIITYSRFGSINCDGLKGGLDIVVKEDISKNTLGEGGRGVHIYYRSKNFEINKITIHQNEAQDTAPSNQVAVAIDGNSIIIPNMHPENIQINTIEILDCRTGGVLIQGKNHHIKEIKIHKWGSDIANTDSIPAYMNMPDYNGELTASILKAITLFDTNAKIDNIWIDQEDGFAARSKALIDVSVHKQLIDSDNTVGYSYYPEIGSINSLNPQREVLSVGATIRQSNLIVRNINIGVVSDDNILITNPTERTNRGLIDLNLASVEIGNVVCMNSKSATLVQQLDRSYSSNQKQNIKAIFNSIHCPVISPSGKMFNCFVNASVQLVMGFSQPYNRESVTVNPYNMPSLKLSTAYTVASLPVGTIGQVAYVTDGTSVSWRGTATGGGSAKVLVFYDGTNWLYH